MKTEYQVRFHTISPTEWIMDVDHLRKSARQLSTAQLWRRQTETMEEAAVRRMAALDKWFEVGSTSVINMKQKTILAFADELSPPPAATETQVDWDTLEPVNEVPVWESVDRLFWIAGRSKVEWKQGQERNLESLLGNFGETPTAAIGHTRESALRNLAELQSVCK